MQLCNSDHEQVVVRRDARTGLTAVIAVHSTRLGPAAGGCRRWRYPDLDAAIYDALRLAEGMTFKNALAGVPLGGGKSVIMADSGSRPDAAQLEVFAGWINELRGRYVAAEDVGMGVEQMRFMALHSPFVSGLGEAGIGGDPSPHTAYGVFLGLQTAVRSAFGAQDLQGLRVAVQGLGSVGMALAKLLADCGAELVVADIDETRTAQARQQFGATVVAPDECVHIPVDVLAPCALGGVITEQVAAQLPARVVAGAANNQLASPRAGEILAGRGVVYAPDFVINAGGVINVAHEYLTQRGELEVPVQQWVTPRLEGIATRVQEILARAESTGRTPDALAREMAGEILRVGRQRAALAA